MQSLCGASGQEIVHNSPCPRHFQCQGQHVRFSRPQVGHQRQNRRTYRLTDGEPLQLTYFRHIDAQSLPRNQLFRYRRRNANGSGQRRQQVQ